jgi:hypothetical protein
LPDPSPWVTVPVKAFNVEWELSALVANGPTATWAKHIIRSGTRIDLRYVKNKSNCSCRARVDCRTAFARRRCRMLFNPPTFVTGMSIMGHRAKVLDYFSVEFELHGAVQCRL